MQPVDLHTVVALQEVKIRDTIKLRPLAKSDAERIITILDADPGIRHHVTVAARLHSEADVWNEVAHYQTDPGLIRYAIVDGNNPIGLVSLWRDSGFFGAQADPNAYGFGYFLDPNKRGKGLVTTSVQKLMDVVSESLANSKFIAFCEDNNADSIAVLKKLGFEPTEETYPEPNHGWLERKYVKTTG